MAPHSSIFAWKIPWMEEPGRLQSMGSRRVRHGWATSFSLFSFMHWRRKRQPTPVFLPGESQGRGSLVGCRLWGRTESDATEVTWQQQGRLLLRLMLGVPPSAQPLHPFSRWIVTELLHVPLSMPGEGVVRAHVHVLSPRPHACKLMESHKEEMLC